MVYLGPDKVMPEMLLGTAKLSYDGAERCLYKVVEVDPRQPALQYMDDIVVQYKAPPINFTELNMQFDLFDDAYKGSINFEWDPPEVDYNAFCEDRIRSVDGFGEISVLYGLFSNGTVASIELKLLNNSVADVYGVVAASNSNLPSPACISLLYVKKPDNKTKVGDGGLIPLTRSCVGVPMDSKLYVYISLHLDDVECKCRLEFDALRAGKIEETLEFDSTWGKKLRMQVTVAWCVDEDAIESLQDSRNDI